VTWTDLAPELARLQSFYESVRGAVASSNLPTEAYSGINGQLRTISQNMWRLRATGDLGLAVIAGTDGAAEKWAQFCNLCGSGLEDILSQLNTEDLVTRFWDEVIVPTAKETREVVAAAAAGGMDVLTLVVIGLIALVVLKVVR